MSDPSPAPEETLDATPWPGRAFATRTLAAVRRIATPEGIERLEQVDVGGDLQWISIRGRNRANPVLLLIHGGPGTAEMPLGWAFQTPWEDFFTVVHWDQRGVGKNAATADREALLPTLSVERILADGEAVIDHLRATLGKERVALLGYSWGAMLGVRLAERLPSKVSVYAGVGQAISTACETMIRAEALAAAERAGDAEAVRELRALSLSPQADGSLPLDQVRSLRRIAWRYNGMWYGHPNMDAMADMAVLAPEYDDADVAAFRAGSTWIMQGPLARDIVACDLRAVTALSVPVVLLLGRHDLATPHAAAVAWLDALTAPAKQLVTFERSAHFAMLEEPGRFLLALVRHVLPHTEGAPDFEPRPR
jgi:proline iminopeptidase